MEKSNKGYIYLLQVRDENGNKVYKLGRTNNFEKRLKNYKFKIILFCIITNDCKKTEAELLLLMEQKYLIVAGREYFECNDEEELINFIRLNVNNINNKIDSIITNQKLYNYKKDIENKLLEEYHIKIENYIKLNDSTINEMNNKITYLEKLNNEKYELIEELNNKNNELYSVISDLKYDINNSKEKIIEDKYNKLLIENKNMEEKYNKLLIENKNIEDNYNKLITENKNIEDMYKNLLIENKNNEDKYKDLKILYIKNNNDQNNLLNENNNIVENENNVIDKFLYQCKICLYKTYRFTDMKAHFMNKKKLCNESYSSYYFTYTLDQRIILSLIPQDTNNIQYINKDDLKKDYNNIYVNNLDKLIEKLSDKNNKKYCCNCKKHFDKIIDLRNHILLECFFNELSINKKEPNSSVS